MKLRQILALVLALVMALSLVACGNNAPATETPNGDTPAETPTSAYPGTAAAGEITVDLGSEPEDLNTITETYNYCFTLTRHYMENLLMLDENANPVPGVAEEMPTISEDGLTYTFKLRQGMKWTNGDPVTAHDFIFAWTKLIDPQVASNYAYFGYQLFKNGEKFYKGECGIEEVGFKAIDDYTIEVVLENPTAYATYMFTFGNFAPVNEKFYNEVGAENYMTEAENFCTNGAFKVTEWVHESKFVIEKNPDYYRADEVSLNKINFLMITAADAKLNSFKAGECDVIGVTGAQAKQLREEGVEVFSVADNSEFHLLMNCEDEMLSNKNLRKAFDLAYSRQALIDAILQNDSMPATSFTANGVNGFDGTSFAAAVEAKYGKLNAGDAQVELANQYLDTALSELGVTKEDVGAHITMNCGDSDTAVNQAAFFQEQFRVNLGIEIQVKSMTTKAQAAERDAGNYDLDVTGWGPDYNDPMTFLDMWVTDGGNNSCNWSNARYDELINLCKSETDLAKRQEYFLECEKILNDECPISCIYWRVKNYIKSDKITGGYVYNSWLEDYRFTTIK